MVIFINIVYDKWRIIPEEWWNNLTIDDKMNYDELMKCNLIKIIFRTNITHILFESNYNIDINNCFENRTDIK